MDYLRNLNIPQVGEVLEYCILDFLGKDRLTTREIVETFREKSSGNLDVPDGEIQRTVERMTNSGDLVAIGGRFELAGRSSKVLKEYRAAEEEAKERSDRAKGAAVEKLISCLDEGSGRVLDVGTGEGYLAFRLAHAGYQVVGVDTNPERIRKAKEKAEAEHREDVAFEVGDIADLEKVEKFDYAVARYVVHHLEDQECALKGIYRNLKPGGKLVCIDYLVGLASFLVHGFITFCAPSEEGWHELLGRCGYGEVRIYPMDDLLVVEAMGPPQRRAGVWRRHNG